MVADFTDLFNIITRLDKLATYTLTRLDKLATYTPVPLRKTLVKPSESS